MTFPGLGIGEFSVNKVAFTLFGREVRWYGLIITLGMILAVAYSIWRAKTTAGSHFKTDDVLDIAIALIIAGVVGARLYYVIMSWKEMGYNSFLDVIAVWNGGLAIYGGIIGGFIALYIVCRVKKKSPWEMLDYAGPSVMLAQAIGRWGNFFNGEAYGYEVAEGSPLFFMRMGISPNIFSSQMAYVHPTFLYESLWNIVGFVLINIFYKKKKFDGQIFLEYLAWYGFGRMFIEGLRSDSLYIFGTVRVSQLVGLLCFVGSVACIIVLLVRERKKAVAAVAEENEPAGEPLEEAPEEDTEEIPEEEIGEADEENAEEAQEMTEESEESEPDMAEDEQNDGSTD